MVSRSAPLQQNYWDQSIQLFSKLIFCALKTTSSNQSKKTTTFAVRLKNLFFCESFCYKIRKDRRTKIEFLISMDKYH